MEQSRKSIVCLSKEFIKSKWANFEFMMSVRERPTDTIVIKIDDLNISDSPKHIRNYLKTNKYLQWNDKNEFEIKRFFTDLRKLLGKPIRQVLDERKQRVEQSFDENK